MVASAANEHAKLRRRQRDNDPRGCRRSCDRRGGRAGRPGIRCRLTRLRSHLGLLVSGLERDQLTAEPFGFGDLQPRFQGGALVWLLARRWRGGSEDGTRHGCQHGLPLAGVEVGQRAGSAPIGGGSGCGCMRGMGLTSRDVGAGVSTTHEGNWHRARGSSSPTTPSCEDSTADPSRRLCGQVKVLRIGAGLRSLSPAYERD